VTPVSTGHRETFSTERKVSRNSGSYFVGFVAMALVVTVLFAGDGTPTPKLHTQLATAGVMDRQMAVAQQAAPEAMTHKLQEAPAEAPEAPAEAAAEAKTEGQAPPVKMAKDDTGITPDDLIPKEVKGGKAAQITKSVEEAWNEKASKGNAHYVSGYSDKEVRSRSDRALPTIRRTRCVSTGQGSCQKTCGLDQGAGRGFNAPRCGAARPLWQRPCAGMEDWGVLRRQHLRVSACRYWSVRVLVYCDDDDAPDFWSMCPNRGGLLSGAPPDGFLPSSWHRSHLLRVEGQEGRGQVNCARATTGCNLKFSPPGATVHDRMSDYASFACFLGGLCSGFLDAASTHQNSICELTNFVLVQKLRMFRTFVGWACII